MLKHIKRYFHLTTKKDLIKENELLSEVYYEARRFLRFKGIDNEAASNALVKMDAAIEKFKDFDSTN